MYLESRREFAKHCALPLLFGTSGCLSAVGSNTENRTQTDQTQTGTSNEIAPDLVIENESNSEKSLTITVRGREFEIVSLDSGESRTLDEVGPLTSEGTVVVAVTDGMTKEVDWSGDPDDSRSLYVTVHENRVEVEDAVE